MRKQRVKHTAGPFAWVRYLLPILILFVAVIYLAFTQNPISDIWMVDDTLYSEEIADAAKRHHLDPQLVRALIWQESRFSPSRKGKAGEVGLMQVHPKWALDDYNRRHHTRYGAGDLLDIRKNLEVGCWYLRKAMTQWQEREYCVDLALAQYNAGPARAKKWAGKSNQAVLEIDIASTRQYIAKIKERHNKYVQDAKTAKERETGWHIR